MIEPETKDWFLPFVSGFARSGAAPTLFVSPLAFVPAIVIFHYFLPLGSYNDH